MGVESLRGMPRPPPVGQPDIEGASVRHPAPDEGRRLLRELPPERLQLLGVVLHCLYQLFILIHPGISPFRSFYTLLGGKTLLTI